MVAHLSDRLDRIEDDVARLKRAAPPAGTPEAALAADGPSPPAAGPEESRMAPAGDIETTGDTMAGERIRPPTAEPRVQPRRRSGAGPVIGVVVLLLLAGGLYWLFAEDGGDRVTAWLDGRDGAMTNGTTEIVEPAEESGGPAEADPETTTDDAGTTLAAVDVEAAPQSGASDAAGEETPAGEALTPPAGAAAEGAADTPAEPEAGAPAAEPAPQVAAQPPGEQAGPAVEAAPSTGVESVALEADIAPLPEDAPEEVRELVQLAMAGESAAQHDLATEYATGEQIPQDYGRAAYWYGLAADAGVANATYNLGVLTETGQGVEQNSAEAFELFLEAAEAGHANAAIAVGLAYMNGRGVERDLNEAASWFQVASAYGSSRGAFHLARLLETTGVDGAPDLTAARGWYRIAADAGDAEAAAALERLGGVADAPAGDMATEMASAVPVPDSTPEPTSPGAVEPAAGGAPTAEVVREIQQLLTELGYDPGPVDGVMGQRTRSAIEDFQTASDLEVDGEPSAALLTALREAESG